MSCDDDLVREFVVEANEHLGDVENQFLIIEEAGDNVDVNLVNEVFRAIHSIKGAAGFLGLTKVNDLAHSLENVLNMMRNLELKPNSQIVEVMLKSADRLLGLINDIENSNSADVTAFTVQLEKIANGAFSGGGAEPVSPDSVAVEASVSVAAKVDSMDDEIERAFAAKRAEAAQASAPVEAPEPKSVLAESPAPQVAEAAPEQANNPKKETS